MNELKYHGPTTEITVQTDSGSVIVSTPFVEYHTTVVEALKTGVIQEDSRMFRFSRDQQNWLRKNFEEG